MSMMSHRVRLMHYSSEFSTFKSTTNDLRVFPGFPVKFVCVSVIASNAPGAGDFVIARHHITWTLMVTK
jgi:hypothetical protein